MNEPNYYIPDRVAFTVFGVDIYWYAIMVVLGILAAIAILYLLFRRRNIPTEWVVDMILCVLPLGIIGARTFSVVTDSGSSLADWFKFRDGGLSIIGGLIGGVLGVILFCLIHKVNFLRIADCTAPGVILAQAIGRWGNFFNQEVYGGVVSDTSLQWFPFAVYIESSGEWHYAFFFYEMLANLVLFALLFSLAWLMKKKPSGLTLAGYLTGYGLVRTIMEPLRDSKYQLGSTVMVSEVMAIIMLVGGILLAAAVLFWNWKKEGCLFGSRKGEPLAILPVYRTKEQIRKEEEERRLRERALTAEENAPESGQPPAGEEPPPRDTEDTAGSGNPPGDGEE